MARAHESAAAPPAVHLGLPRARLQAHLKARGFASAAAMANASMAATIFSWHHNPFTHGLRLHLPRECPSLKPLCIAQSFPNTLATLRLLFAELCAEHVDQLCCQRVAQRRDRAALLARGDFEGTSAHELIAANGPTRDALAAAQQQFVCIKPALLS